MASLTIHQVPSVQVSPQGSVFVKLGSQLTIRCSVSGDPTPTLSWRKIAPGVRQLGSSSPVLQVFQVSKEDEGTYACVAENIAGETEERVQVIVTEDDYTGVEEVREDPRSGGAETGEYVVELGNNVRLTADIIGNMARDIVTNWTRADNARIDTRHYQRGNTLYINSATRADAGVYICRGYDRYGGVVFSYRANVIIASAPRIQLKPDHQVVRPEDSPRVRCEVVQGDQPVTIQWSREGGQPFPRSALQSGPVLQFRGIMTSDAGRYVCSASNTAGHSQAMILL